MKSGYNFTKQAFFDVMNEESMYGRKGGKEHSIQLIKMLSKEPAVDKSQEEKLAFTHALFWHCS